MFSYLFTQLVKVSKLFSRERLYELLSGEVDKLVEKGSNLNILNVGSSGDIEKYIRVINNATITSIDIDEQREPDIVMDATNMTFDDNKFDAIFIMEVLEHIPEPHKAIDEIYRTLKKNGTLILSAPYVFGIHDKPYDFYRYTKHGLSYLLRNFKDVEIKHRNSYINTLVVLVARLMKADAKSDKMIGGVLFLMILSVYPLLYILSKMIKSDDITTGYFVVAKK